METIAYIFLRWYNNLTRYRNHRFRTGTREHCNMNLYSRYPTAPGFTKWKSYDFLKFML